MSYFVIARHQQMSHEFTSCLCSGNSVVGHSREELVVPIIGCTMFIENTHFFLCNAVTDYDNIGGMYTWCSGGK